MTQLPSAIVMLVKDRAFMTVRDFEAADGSPPTGQDGKPPSRADGKPARGIAPLSDKFGLDATIDVWQAALNEQLDKETGGKVTSHDDVVGNLVLVGETDDQGERQNRLLMAPLPPAVTLVRVTKDAEPILVRWLSIHGTAYGQEFSVFALMEDDAPLLADYKKSMAEERAGRDWLIPYSAFSAANLVPVYSSITIPMTTVVKTEVGSRSDSAGDAFGSKSDSVGEGYE